jgi:RNA polymerase sigma factor (sigma-70 family)
MVNRQTDQQLLRDYAGHRSEPAFAELVRRHVDLVHSAAVRMVRDAHLAEDVTQGVFLALAHQAGQLADRPVLSGWLHRTAQNLAANTVRADVRRRVREQEAAIMNELSAPAPDASWEEIAPQLDAALGELTETDRDAVLLRYFERKSAREMAGLLGLSDEAAQKRVNRAVERLRDHFAKRKVTIGTGGLAVVLSANAVQAAPAGLAATITTAAALAGTAAGTATALVAVQTIVMTTLQKTIITAAFAVAAGAGIYEAHQVAQLRAQNQALQQTQTPPAGLVQQLQTERDEATNRLAALVAENARLKSGRDAAELLQLRGEVGRLRLAMNDLPAARIARLKEKLAAMPDKQIPELKFLTAKDWTNAVWNADLDTDDGVRLALSKLRDESVDTFLALTRKALKQYLAANNNVLPADLLPLKPYYDPPVTDDMLQRYAFMQTGTISANHSDSVVRKAVYADPDYDSNQEMSLNGGGGGSWNHYRDAIYNATMDYVLANNGQTPDDPSQIAAYLKRPVDAVTLQKYLGEVTADIAGNPPSPDTIMNFTLQPAITAYAAAHNGQRFPNPADLLPYLTTPAQQAAFQRLQQGASGPR